MACRSSPQQCIYVFKTRAYFQKVGQDQTLFIILYHVHCNYSKIPDDIGHRNSGADQVRKKDTDFSFYLVLYLHRSSSKLKHLSHKSDESTKHLLIHCGISKHDRLIFPTLPQKTHIKQQLQGVACRSPLRCRHLAGRGQGYEETNDSQ